MNLDETESKLNEFSDAFYLSMVEKVIIGKKDDGRKANPYHITFVLKSRLITIWKYQIWKLYPITSLSVH
jgi:hypothetical protein